MSLGLQKEGKAMFTEEISYTIGTSYTAEETYENMNKPLILQSVVVNKLPCSSYIFYRLRKVAPYSYHYLKSRKLVLYFLRRENFGKYFPC